MKTSKFIIFWLLMCVLSLTSFSASSQTKPADTCFTTKQISGLYNGLHKLKVDDSLKTVLISQYDMQLYNYRLLHKTDSTISYLQNDEIAGLNKKIILLTPKWYDNNKFWFITGIIATVLIYHLK